MNESILIMKKEFARFFSDKRMIFSALILPGLIIYIIYSLMGSMFNDSSEEYIPKVCVINQQESFGIIENNMKMDLTMESEEFTDDIKEKIRNNELDLCIVYSDDFDEKVSEYDSVSSIEVAPSVELYYNTAETNSYNAYVNVVGLLEQYESTLVNKFNVNPGNKEYGISDEESSYTEMLGMILPIIMLCLLFSGCNAIAPESIAGEKERGTLASTMILPIKRSSIAIGKIVSLSVLGLLSGLSSFIGVMLSLPNMLEDSTENLGFAMYSAKEFALIFIVIVSTVLIIVTVFSIISALSKSIKEASMTTAPLMIIVLIIGFTSMTGSSEKTNLFKYLIPVYNSEISLSRLFCINYEVSDILITVGTNVLVTLLLVVILTKLFECEKVMFQK